MNFGMNFGGNNFIWIIFLLMFMQGGNGMDSSMLMLVLLLCMMQGNGFGICEAK